MKLERIARAKINLGLAVTGRREDGYHELSSVFVRVGLADRLAMTVPVPALEDDVLAVADDAEVPTEGNLVLSATHMLREMHRSASGATEERLPGLAIALEKGIPMAAGMAGGSSDAAAALALAPEAWGIERQDVEPGELARRLGADVPFFVADVDAALVGGLGESVEPLAAIDGGAGFLLVTPRMTLSTAAVFARHDELPVAMSAASEAVSALAELMRSGLDGGGLAAQATQLAAANDLWPAARSLEPVLGTIRDRLTDALDRPLLMTGSGTTLFALYPSVTEAVEAGRTLADEAPDELAGAIVHAVDPISAHASWRYP